MILALAMAGCGGPDVSASADVAASPTPSAAPTATPLAVLAPGRPFDADAILEAMRESRRPGGVPDQLQTNEIASAIARSIWTIDGEPWTSMTIGGSCGPTRCTLEVGGARPETAGEDLWSFEVIPASAEVVVLDATLRSLPHGLVELLDEVAREGPLVASAGLQLTSARWLGPDEGQRFRLAYRIGNEEGSCAMEVTVDLATGETSDERRSAC